MSFRRLCLSSAAILVAVSSPAFAAPTIIGSGASVSFNAPQVQSAGATTQIRFDDGSVVSFVGEANYVITGDRQIRIESGNITVLGRSLPLTIVSGSTTITIDGGAALTLSQGRIRSHVFSGTAQVMNGGQRRSYSAGQAWQIQGSSVSRVVAAGPQAVPSVIDLRGNGVSAAALTGLPVVLGEALAALGASSDIIAAGRSFEAVQQGVFDVSTPALPRDLERLIAFQRALAAKLGGAGAFQGSSPAIIDIYLRYLASGGRIVEFQTVYTNLITTYLELLSTGGSPSDFTDLGGLDIQGYLEYLQSVDGLGRLGATQQGLVAEYLTFLRNGGDPAVFISTNVQLDADVIALYQNILGNFVAFVRGGGSPTAFDAANQDLIARYIRLLASAGQLDTLFGTQADVLRAYATFVVAGGSPGDFDRFDEFGLSEALIANYTTTLQTYLSFLFDGGSVAGFNVDPAALAQLIIELEQADALLAALPERRAVLLEFAAFVRAGNSAADFFGFYTAGLSDAAVEQYATSVYSLLSVYGMGGTFADFDGNLADIIRVIQILEAAGQLDDEFANARTTLLQFVTFVTGGGDAANFDGFVSLGFDSATVARYVTTINALLSFVFDGGDLAAFSGDVDEIVTLIKALEASGQLQTGLATQRPVLLDFVTFIADGGNIATYRGFLALGLSDTVVQTYGDAITVFLQFIIDGGEIADFSGDVSAILANINDLQSAGRLSGVFSGSSLDALLAFSAFIADGGVPEDFTGFDGLTDIGGGDGGNQNTGDGYSGGPEVALVTEVDRDAIAAFAFNRAQGRALIDFGAGNGNSRIGSRVFSFPRFGNNFDEDGLPAESLYTVRDMDLIAAEASGDVLLTRHSGTGSALVNFRSSNFDGSVFLDSVFVADAATLLPTSGQIIYDLDRTLGVQVVGDYDGGVSLDMVLGVRFGTVPLVALNGVMSADADYVFSTGDNGLTGLNFETTSSSLLDASFGVYANLLSGSGAFCSEGSTCGFIINVIPTGDFSRLGGTFSSSSSNPNDSAADAALSFIARDGFSFETIIPEVTPSGSVSAAFGTDRATLLRANGGSSNRSADAVSIDSQTALAFDSKGLSVMFRGLSSAVNRGSGAVADLAGDEDWQVGRWVGQIGPDIFGPDSGLSYAVIPLLASTPANGRIDYTLLGATRPVYGDGSTAPGTFDGRAVLVIGTTPFFGIDATVTMPDATYNFVTNGGLDDPSIDLSFRQQSLRGFANSSETVTTVTGTGAVCPEATDTCATSLGVAVGGENGSYAGVSYRIFNFGTLGTALSGTAVFGGTLVPDEPETPLEGIQRDDQFVVYSSNEVGIDSRDPATVIYDETTGAPLAYTWDLNDFTKENERPQIGTATLRESGSVDGVIGWARWAGGRTAGRYYSQTNGIELPENAGWHVLSGTPATNLPTSGTVSYDLIGATSPTVRNGTVSPGTLDSAKAAVAFGTTARVGIEMAMTVGGEAYNISSIGGVSDLSQGLEIRADEAGRNVKFGGNGLNGTLLASGGSLCAGDIAGCNATLNGYLAGDGASHLGVSYTLGNVGFERQIDGAAAFARADASSTKVETSAVTTVKQNMPVVNETWARWNHGSGALKEVPEVRSVSRNGRGEVGPIGQTVPDWITFDHR